LSAWAAVLHAGLLNLDRPDTCEDGALRQRAVADDPQLIPPLVALLQEDLLAMQLCSPSGAMRVGLAVAETLFNALYHRNLEIPAPLRFQDKEAFLQLVEERRSRSPYNRRRTRLFVNLTTAEAVYVIMDDGPAFDPKSLPDPSRPAAMIESTERAAVLMRTHVDQAKYSLNGSQVTLLKRREKPRA
jgi:hypothetical protein